MFPVEKIHRDLIVNVANALHGVKQQFFFVCCFIVFFFHVSVTSWPKNGIVSQT